MDRGTFVHGMDYYIAHFVMAWIYFIICGDIPPSIVDVEEYFIGIYCIISFVDILFLLPWSMSLFSPIILLLEGETTCICSWYLYLFMVLAPSIHPWYSHIVLRGLSYYKS